MNNSHQAALDVYDFLQKFYKIFPGFSRCVLSHYILLSTGHLMHCVRSPFILAGGSYGGIFVPNIASVIHKENLAIRAGHGQPGAKHINLHSMMLSNPVVVRDLHSLLSSRSIKINVNLGPIISFCVASLLSLRGLEDLQCHHLPGCVRQFTGMYRSREPCI